MLTQSLSVNEFYRLRDAEDYFEFFGIAYDKSLLGAKRFHILKEYSVMIKKGMEHLSSDEGKMLDFLKFSLLKVYGKFKDGYAPSAAEVWNMFDNGKLSGCASCTPQQGNSCGC
ncbi:MAG: nitrogenase-stabilizing/protective protein NifW [Sulfurovaceae bacterium]